MKFADFILTGTGVYGPKRPGESDIDIVLMHEDAENLKNDLLNRCSVYELLGGLGYPEEGRTFYFFLGNLKFNIIVAMNEEDFKWWEEQTELMKKLAPIKDRKERLKAFRAGGYV